MNRKAQISRDISIELLIEKYPFATHYLASKGIRCVACGEPVWLTLEEAAYERGFTDQDIDIFINDLKMMAMNEINYQNGTREQACELPNCQKNS